MKRVCFDINNENKKYLDEKELFIFYYLSKKKHISTMWSGVFVPNPTKIFPKPDETPEDLFKRMTYRGQSVIILKYLFDLGKLLDEDNFSIYCNADCSLIEGGFLTDDIRGIMYRYLEDSDKGRRSRTKYKKLNKETKKFLNEVLGGKRDLNSLKEGVKFTDLANPPIKAYREAILEEKADKEFIELVNKLITDYDGSRWDTEDVKKFLKIWYENNKSLIISEKEGIFYEDTQKKLARIIFENIDIHLNIKDTKKLDKFICEYIDLYKSDELDGISQAGLTRSFFSASLSKDIYKKFYGFERQKEILNKHIEDIYKEYRRKDLEIGNPFIEPEYIGDDDGESFKIERVEEKKEKDLFLFAHTMIAFEKDGKFDVKSFSYGTKHMFDLYDWGFLFQIKTDNFKKEKIKKNDKKELKSDFIEIKGIKDKFVLNLENGDFTFNKTEGTFPLVSQEYKVIKKLIQSDSYQSDYENLVKSVWVNRNNSKASRNDLSLIIKKIKIKLCILPKKKSNNNDIFKNIKNFGYRIIVK